MTNAPCVRDQVFPGLSTVRAEGAAEERTQVEVDLMQKIRFLDKLIDELAKGKPMDKILRK